MVRSPAGKPGGTQTVNGMDGFDGTYAFQSDEPSGYIEVPFKKPLTGYITWDDGSESTVLSPLFEGTLRIGVGFLCVEGDTAASQPAIFTSGAGCYMDAGFGAHFSFGYTGGGFGSTAEQAVQCPGMQGGGAIASITGGGELFIGASITFNVV